MSRDVQIYCPCGARLTTLHLPDGWEGGDNYDHWMKCYNCGRDVAYNHDGRKGHAWYINNKSSNSYDDYDNGSDFDYGDNDTFQDCDDLDANDSGFNDCDDYDDYDDD